MTEEPRPDEGGAATPYRTLASLSEEHADLLKRYNLHRTRKAPADDSLWDRVEEFVRQGAAAGAYINDDAERWTAQSILEYWSAALFRADRMPPGSVLVKFEQRLSEEQVDSECPYVGLEAFRDSKHFYGRQKLVDEIVEKLKTSRLVAVVGQSGSGKSSLVMGGLLPYLRGGNAPGSGEWVYLPPMVPGTDPQGAVLKLFFPQLPPRERDAMRKRLLDEPSRMAELFGATKLRPAVLFVDQFEEVFSLCTAAVRLAFIESLLSVLRSPSPGHVIVLTMRSDYNREVKKLPAPEGRDEHPFTEAFDAARVLVKQMEPAELLEVVVRPAMAARVKFTDGVAERLVQEVAPDPAALPLLQFTLLKLWEHREHNAITKRSYRAVGGPFSALENAAERLYESLSPEQREILRLLLVRIVRPTGGMEFTSGRQPLKLAFSRSYSFEAVKAVLQRLVEERLVRLTGLDIVNTPEFVRGLKEGEVPDEVSIEVTHEALVRNWKRLSDWLDEVRAAMVVHHRFEQKGAEWLRLNGGEKGPNGLLDEAQLSELKAWLENPQSRLLGHEKTLDDLAEESQKALDAARRAKEKQYWALVQVQQQRAEAEFLRAEAESQRAEAESQRAEAETHRAEAERRRADEEGRAKRFLRFLLGGAMVSAVVLSFVAWKAYTNSEMAEEQSRIALSNKLAAQSLYYLDKRPDLSLLLGLQGLAVTGENIEARNSLISAFAERPSLKTFLHGHPTAVEQLVFTAEGGLVSLDDRGRVGLWNVGKGKAESITDMPYGQTASKVSLSPDGRTVVTADNGLGVARSVLTAWDVQTAQQRKAFEPLNVDGAVKHLSFAPDGRTLAAATSEPSKVILWDVETGKTLKTLSGGDVSINTLAFGPDGGALAAGLADGRVLVWNIETGKYDELDFKNQKPVERLVLLSDNLHLVVANEDGPYLNVWNFKERALVAAFSSGTSVAALVAARDRPAFAYSNDEMGAYVVSLGNRENTSLHHKGLINAMAFSPDGKTLATGGLDDKIALWSVGDGEQLMVRRVTLASVSGLALSRDGRTIAAGASEGRTLALCDLNEGTRFKKLPAVEEDEPDSLGMITSVAYRPDDGALASDSAGGKAVLFWTRAGERWEPHALKGHNEYVASVAFSPDGRLLASGGGDGEVIFWDAASGELKRRLPAGAAAINGLAFSPDGRTLAASSAEGRVSLLRPDGEGEAFTLTGRKVPVRRLAFSRDGKLLAGGGLDQKITVWSVAERKPLHEFAGPGSGVTSLAFRPDDRLLAAGARDGSVHLFDVATRSPVGILPSFLQSEVSADVDDRTAGNTGVAFMPDGKRLVVLSNAGEDLFFTGGVVIWNVDVESWRDRACGIANRPFTKQEWEKFMDGSEVFEPVCGPLSN